MRRLLYWSEIKMLPGVLKVFPWAEAKVALEAASEIAQAHILRFDHCMTILLLIPRRHPATSGAGLGICGARACKIAVRVKGKFEMQGPRNCQGSVKRMSLLAGIRPFACAVRGEESCLRQFWERHR